MFVDLADYPDAFPAFFKFTFFTTSCQILRTTNPSFGYSKSLPLCHTGTLQLLTIRIVRVIIFNVTVMAYLIHWDTINHFYGCTLLLLR